MGGCARAGWEAEWERRRGCDTEATCCEQELPEQGDFLDREWWSGVLQINEDLKKGK